MSSASQPIAPLTVLDLIQIYLRHHGLKQLGPLLHLRGEDGQAHQELALQVGADDVAYIGDLQQSQKRVLLHRQVHQGSSSEIRPLLSSTAQLPKARETQ